MIDVSDICRMEIEAQDMQYNLNRWQKVCKEKRLALEYEGGAWQTAYDIEKTARKFDLALMDILGEMDKLIEQIKKETKKERK